MGRALGLALCVSACSFDHGSLHDAAPDDAQFGPRDGGIPVTDAPDGPQASGCPSGYLGTSTMGYRYVAIPASWLAAEQDCDDDGVGVHLAVLVPTNEGMAVDAVSTASETWIGASNRRGTWRWVTGASLSPPNSLIGTRCALWSSGSDEQGPWQQPAGINTRDCNDTRPYVCECDGVEPDPSAF